MNFPIWWESHKIHVPNHQPVSIPATPSNHFGQSTLKTVMFCWSPHVWLNSSPCFCGSTPVVQIFVFSPTTPSDVAPLKFHPFCCSNPKIHLKSSETPTCCHETPLVHTSSPFLDQFPSIFLIPFSPLMEMSLHAIFIPFHPPAAIYYPMILSYQVISPWWYICMYMYTYPSEKSWSEFVSWDDELPNIWKNEIHVPKHIYTL